jgi:hypothetical protein
MLKKKKTDIEPTPEDRRRALDRIANSREILMERLVQDEARRRVEAERGAARQERRRGFLRRLFPFRRAA